MAGSKRHCQAILPLRTGLAAPSTAHHSDETRIILMKHGRLVKHVGRCCMANPLDLPTFAAVVAVLIAAAAGAIYLPARRAIRIRAMTALRAE